MDRAVSDHQLLAGTGEARTLIPSDGQGAARLCSRAPAGEVAHRAGGVTYILKKIIGVLLTANN